MGAALSPSSQKPTRGPERQNLSNKQDGHEDADKGGKRKTHPLLLHALSWKKRLMVAKTRRRGAKKVNPVHAHGELRGHATDDDPLGAKKTGQKNGDVPLPVPKRVVMQVSGTWVGWWGRGCQLVTYKKLIFGNLTKMFQDMLTFGFTCLYFTLKDRKCSGS